jgi:hypothetical protein
MQETEPFSSRHSDFLISEIPLYEMQEVVSACCIRQVFSEWLYFWLYGGEMLPYCVTKKPEQTPVGTILNTRAFFRFRGI